MYRISKLWFAGYFIFLFFCQLSFAQTPKGAIPISEEKTETGKTRALVVGISQYQFIDKLQFADRDAEVFAQYLLDSHFWGVDKDDITILLNDKAKNGDIITQLARLAQLTKPGDNLIFYFSGHGDVETITQFNNGYLLASDTYSNNYIAGALPVSFIKELFLTLTNKNVKVVLITDACRSGKLAGGMKGSEYVATAISNMWNNEIKILSTQPGHLSYEDKKWGDGRGVFSLYLVKGLSGEADANKDSLITLNELQQYVGSNVARETKNDQQPIVEGPNPYSTVIARIGSYKPAAGSGRNSGNSFSLKFSWPLDSCTFYYEEMRKAIKDQRFDTKEPVNAVHYYKKMKTCGADQGMILQANSELLAGLMNASQEIINNSFVGKTLVPIEKFREANGLIDQILEYNDLHLPNTNHLLNLKRYLSVMGSAVWNDFSDPVKLTPIIDSAIREEKDAAYLLCAKAAVEMRRKNWNLAIELLNETLQKSPSWLYPKYLLGQCFSSKKQYNKALEYFEEIFQKDSSYHTFECTKCILIEMAEYADKTGQKEKANDYRFTCMRMFPDYDTPFDDIYDKIEKKSDPSLLKRLVDALMLNDTMIYHRCMLFKIKTQLQNIDPQEAGIDSLLPSCRNRTDSSYCYSMLGDHYRSKKFKDRDLAYDNYYAALEMDSTDIENIAIMAAFLMEDDNYDEAEELLVSKISQFKGEERAGLAVLLVECYVNNEKPEKAFTHLKSLVEQGYISCKEMRSLKKYFKDYKPFEEYLKTCVSTTVKED